MSALNDTRLVLKVSELYYLKDKSQKEISEQLGLSRPQVCRMIAQAKENGLVLIQLNNPFADESCLEQKIVSRYGLQDALVIDDTGANEEDSHAKFSAEAAGYFDNLISSGMTIGVMSGYTVAQLIENIPQGNKKVKQIVPLVGGIGTERIDVHANYCAQRLAQAYHSSALSLNAPFILSNSNVAELMRNEPNIKTVLSAMRKCDIVLVGIGTVQEKSTTARAGGMSREDLEQLTQEDAVASVCCSFLNSSGQETALSLTERSIGQTISKMNRTKVIACAFGKTKVDAIRAALNSRGINVLITNAETAKAILNEE